MGNTLSPPGTRALLLLQLLALLVAAPLAAAEPAEGDADAAPAEAGPDPTPGQAGTEEPPPPEAAAEPTDEAAEAGQAGDAPDEPAAVEPDLDLEGPVPATQHTEGVEEIIVTGVRLEGSLQAEPVSATTFGSEELKSLRIQNISDLDDYTSNLEINTAFAASNPTLFIRGIGLKDYNANAASAVSVYQDGINLNSPAIQLFQLFDVDHVQVLKGPQGGPGGRNATAGAILVNSAVPDGEFDFGGSFTYGSYNTIQGEMAMSSPLLYDAFSVRVAGIANFQDGTTKNRCANWDPEAEGFNRVDQQTTEESYAALFPSDQRVDVLRERRPPLPPVRSSEFVYFGSEEVLRQNELGNVDQIRTLAAPVTVPDPANPGQFLTFPAGTVVGLQGTSFRRTDFDNVCILDIPGFITTPLGAQTGGTAGEYRPNNVTQLSDFQGLSPTVNNVKDWAGRTIIRFQPQGGPFKALEGTDWLLNFHGGQNLSGSSHLQMLGANALLTGGFVESLEANFSEAKAARFIGSERLRTVKGLQESDIGPGQGGANPFVGYYNSDGLELLDTWGTSLRGEWDLGAVGDAGSVVLTSLTGTEWYDRQVDDEGDANPAGVFPANWQDSARQISQEVRADGETDRFGWTAGLFFLHEQVDALNVFPDTRNFRLEQTFDQTLTSIAPFLGGRIPLSDELGLELGFRYNIEDKEFNLKSTAIGNASGAEVQEISETRTATWTGPTGGVTLTYMPTWALLERARADEVRMYLKYIRGMKGGHFNASLTVRNGLLGGGADPVNPEFIHSIEGGWKSSWLEDRLLFNIALFRYWYEDYQVFDIDNEIGALPLQKLLNADARVWGGEVEVELRPFPGTFLGTGIGFIDSRFKDFTVTKAVSPGPRGIPDEETFDYDGNPTIASPRLNLSAIFEQEIPLWGYGMLIPSYSFSYSSKQYLDPQKLDPISQDPYWIHNARLAYRTEDEKIEIALWVDNLFDERYKIDVFDLTREFNTILEVWNDPRMYGVTLSYRWR